MTRRGILTLAFGLLALGLVVVWVAWHQCGFRGCPEVDELSGYIPDEASVVVDEDGDELAKLYRVHRVIVPLDSLPEYVPQAFVAIEDDRFWEHDGVDWRRMIGASWANLRSLSFRQGFSTITMQLARNIFPEALPADEETISRKLAEMRVARMIEDRYTKEEILELYLNQIYYGDGAWGIEAASERYFGIPASELTLAQGALLAGLPVAPARLNPRVAPERALARRDLVLRRMAAEGMISTERAREAADEPLDLARGSADEERIAPYFVEAVRRRLEEEIGPDLYTGGYTIHTTLDAEVQRVAERELADQLGAIEAGRYGRYTGRTYPADGGGADGMTDYLQGAVVVLDARSGAVLAMVGGRDHEHSVFNRATQAARQPGSAFKPFVYAAALADGVPLTRPLRDTPLSVALDNGRVWTPRNYGGGYSGLVSVRDALVHSKNIATVRLAQEVGIETVIETAERLGIESELPEYPSVALGSGEVTLLEMTAAYAAFATLGRRPEPRLVTRVEDPDGRVIWERPVRSRPVLEPAVAFLLTDVLRDVIDRGTAASVRANGFSGTAAGKTGTTNDATDTWFIGYTPDRVTGVWIGFDRPERILPGATGGELAAPVWADIMRRAAPASGGWSPPSGIERFHVDAAGNVFETDCRLAGSLRVEYFLRGTVSPRPCGLARGLPDSLLRLYLDSAGVDPDDEDWWRRLRRRLFDDDDAPDLPDSLLPGRPDDRRRDDDRGDRADDRDSDRGDRRADDDDDDEPGPDRRWRSREPPDLLGRPVDPRRPSPADTTSRRDDDDDGDGGGGGDGGDNGDNGDNGDGDAGGRAAERPLADHPRVP